MRGVLIFTRTTGYRHDSIEAGAAAVQSLAEGDGFAVTHTEDPAVFTAERLADVAVVVWLSTSGDVLDEAQREAFGQWLAAGGAWAGIHAASTAEPSWPEFARIVGARFTEHPPVQHGRVRVEDPHHWSTALLPEVWEHTDEWYNFDRNPRGEVHVLLTADESSYEGGSMGADHPLAWTSTYGEGRCWYTALGHGAELYAHPRFLAHLAGGLRSLWSEGSTLPPDLTSGF